MDNKSTSLTELFNKLIKEADNRENVAFRVAAEHTLPSGTIKKIEENAKQILEAVKADREKNKEA